MEASSAIAGHRLVEPSRRVLGTSCAGRVFTPAIPALLPLQIEILTQVR